MKRPSDKSRAQALSVQLGTGPPAGGGDIGGDIGGGGMSCLEGVAARLQGIEEWLAALEALVGGLNVQQALDDEINARVTLEDQLQELEVSVNTHGQEIGAIHTALQDHADAIDACSAALWPEEPNPRQSMRVGPGFALPDQTKGIGTRCKRQHECSS